MERGATSQRSVYCVIYSRQPCRLRQQLLPPPSFFLAHKATTRPQFRTVVPHRTVWNGIKGRTHGTPGRNWTSFGCQRCFASCLSELRCSCRHIMGRILAQGHLQCADPAAGLKKTLCLQKCFSKITEKLHATDEPAFNALVNGTPGLG